MMNFARTLLQHVGESKARQTCCALLQMLNYEWTIAALGRGVVNIQLSHLQSLNLSLLIPSIFPHSLLHTLLATSLYFLSFDCCMVVLKKVPSSVFIVIIMGNSVSCLCSSATT